MASLIPQSFQRTTGYKIGGALGVILIPTLLASGLPGYTVTRSSGSISAIAVATGNTPVFLDAEDNSILWSGNTAIGNNRFITPSLGLKLGGASDAVATIQKALDLTRYTALVHTRNGEVMLLGEKNGMISTQANYGAGAGNDDFAGLDVVIAGGEVDNVPVVPLSVYNDIRADIADAEA